MLVNGKPWEECQAAAGHMAGSYCTVERDFRAGAEQLPRILSSPASFSHHDHFWSRTGSHESAQCQKPGVRVALMCVISAGDTIAMTLPMSVRAERVQDSRADYSSLHVCRVILLCCCTRTAPHSHSIAYDTFRNQQICVQHHALWPKGSHEPLSQQDCAYIGWKGCVVCRPSWWGHCSWLG